MTVSMQGLVADPELAAIQRRREMLMGILRSNNQNQNYTSAVSPLGPVANALAAALLDYTGKREEDQLSARRGEELANFSRNVPSLGALLPGGSPAASAIPNNTPPSPEVAPRAIPTSASLPAPTLPNGRPDFSRMADSAPAPDGQGFDPRARNAEFAQRRQQAMATLSGPALDQELARISADQARVSSGLPTGPVYRRPEAERGSLWAAAAPAAPPSGAVPALGTPGDAPRAIPAQATPPQAPAAPLAAPGASPQALEAAAAQRLQMAAEAAQSTNPRIREQATRLQAEAQFLMGMARRETPNVGTVAPGSYMTNPRTGQIIGQAPREPREWQEVYSEVQRLQQRVASGQATPDERRNLPRLEERLAGLTQPTGEGSFQRELGQRGASRVDAQLEAATGARERVMTGQRIMQALSSGAITGTGAGMRESLERALATAGLVDGSRVANTRQLMADLANGVLEASGSLRGPTSDRDILFLREAAGGNIDLTPDAIRRIAQISMDRATRDITRWNSTAQSIQGDQGIPAQIRHMYRPIEIPTVDAQPAGAPSRAAPAQAPAGIQAEPPGGGRQPVRVRTPEEARRLPSGTPIILPDGRQGVVP